MKTREEFVLLADAYRKEVRHRALIIWSIIVGANIACIMVAELMSRYLGHHLLLIGIWFVPFFLTMLGFNFYQTKSQESLARKLELACPNCSHVIGDADLKLAISTQNCPYCGSLVFS